MVDKLNDRATQQQMARRFNIAFSFSFTYVSRNGVIFDSFLKDVVAVDSKEVYWPQILAFCLYAQFLLVSPSGDCDLKVI